MNLQCSAVLRFAVITGCAGAMGAVAWPAWAADRAAEEAAGAAHETKSVKPANAATNAASAAVPDKAADGKPRAAAAKPADAASDAAIDKPFAHLIDKPRTGIGADVGLPDLRQRIDDRLAQLRSKRQQADAAPMQRVAGMAPGGTGAAGIAAAGTAASGVAAPRVAPAVQKVASRPKPPPQVPPQLPPPPPHWSYAGEGGPATWAQLKPDFSTCATGKRQSPIDIEGGIAVDLERIQFDYKPSAFRVIDDGMTVQVNVAPGNFLGVGGRRYELQEFHFHRPSEERINGRQFELVAHLTHRDADGRLAVVAVLMNQGKAHPLVQLVWNNLPLERGEEQLAPMPMDLAALLPEDRSYYTYMGSLSTPPCREGVLWLVMRQPASLSPDQLAIFAKLYPMNARPLQASNGRLIKQSQ